MKTFSTLLSADKSYTLQNGSGADRASQNISSRDTGVPDAKLEDAYTKVPVVFNAINKTTQIILSRDRAIEGPNAGFFREFVDSIGEIGGDSHWEEVLERIYRYQFIYGECFIELVRNGRGDRIVDLAFIDPKTIEYATGNRGDDIALDEHGNPVGYVQTVGHRGAGVEQKFDIPDGVGVSANEIFIPADRIAHFKMFTVGNGFHPVGLLEPVFQEAERLFELEADFAEKAHTLFPLRIGKVGDENHEPTPEKTNTILSNMREASGNTEIAVPYHVDFEMLEAENPEALIEFFNRYDDQIITGMGLPKAFATGMGEDVNRATLRAQDRVFQQSMRNIINRTTRTIERQIFEPIARLEGLDDHPEYNWDTDVDLPEDNIQGG